MGLSLGAPEDDGAKRIREEHKVSMATSGWQPPPVPIHWPSKTQDSGTSI